MAKQLVDALGMQRVLTRMTYEIIEKNKGLQDTVLVGIKTRGIYLAQRIAARIKQLEGEDVPVGTLDITLYRDDHHAIGHREQATVHGADLPVDIDDKTVVLIDDVLFTGRTARAAMDALVAHGRPQRIMLAVLVDRGTGSYRFALTSWARTYPPQPRNKLPWRSQRWTTTTALQLNKYS